MLTWPPRIVLAGRARVAVALVASVGLGAIVAQGPAAAGARSAEPGKAAAPKAGKKLVVSPNWSGYVATSPAGKQISYTSVSGTWTVPTAHCRGHKAGTYSTVLVGIGGYSYEKQEEVGTNSDCDKSGKASYRAWFELVPYLSYPTSVNNKVRPGDTITGRVRILKAKMSVEFQIRNRTRGWTFTRRIHWPTPDTTSAEWIVAAPSTCIRYTCTQASLTNFGSITMRNISAVGDSESGTLKNPHWKVVGLRLVPGRLKVPTLNPYAPPTKMGKAASPAGATPGKLSADGRSFRWSWVKVATRGL